MRDNVTVLVPLHGSLQPVRLSWHAIDRYRERVRSGVSYDRAAEELRHVIGLAVVRTSAPTWLPPTSQRPAFYLLIGDIALPADPDPTDRTHLLVRTVLLRDGHPRRAKTRASRRSHSNDASERRARHRERRRAQERRERRRAARARRRSQTARGRSARSGRR